MHGDHIHIPFAEDDVGLPAEPCQIQAVQVPALVKYPRLRRIQIFGLAVAHDPAAEPDHPVVNVHNRKNHPVPEFIIHAPLFVHLHQPGFLQKLVRIPFALQILIEAGAVLIRVTQPELPYRLLAELPSQQIIKPWLAQGIIIIFCSQPVHLHDLRLEIRLLPGFL